MHKQVLDTLNTDIEQLLTKTKARLEEAQSRDASAIRADLSDLQDRINALELRRDEQHKLLDAHHAEQKKAFNQTFEALLKFEVDRKEALEARLAGMTGEEKKTNSRRKPKAQIVDKTEAYDMGKGRADAPSETGNDGLDQVGG